MAMPISIWVTILSVRGVAIHVDSCDTIEAVKEKICEKEGVPVDEQRLEYMGKVLEDGRTLAHYRIGSCSNLDLSVKPRGMQILVRNYIGRIRILDVQSSDTIASVKEKIEFEQGISPNHQRLFYSYKELEDDKTLADYNIQKESTLFMLLRLLGGF